MTEINKHYRYGKRFKDFDIDVKALTDGSRKISGYASVWGNVDAAGDVMMRGAFAKSIIERGPNSTTNRKIAFLWQHQMDVPLGRITVLKEDEYGLYFEAEISKTQKGDETIAQLLDGTLNQFSFGFKYVMDKCTYDRSTDVFYVGEVYLSELSVVTLGCNELTVFTGMKQLSKTQLIEENTKLNKVTNTFKRALTEDQRIELDEIIQQHIALAYAEPQRHSSKTEPQKGFDVELLINKINKTTFLQ